jgi:hypothetical protein
LKVLSELQVSARRDIQRWLAEVGDGTLRGTLSAGILRQAFAYAEDMVRQAAKIFVDAAGAAGAEALVAAADGKKKPIEKLTFGQCVKLLDMLDARKLIAPRRKAISRVDRELLAALTVARNDFAHASPSGLGDGASMRTTLENVRTLSCMPVIEWAAHEVKVSSPI